MDSTSKISRPFSKNQAWLMTAIILAGLLLRWIGLDWRPVHHDESLHAMYGRYFYDFPDIQFYKYDPMLHGPFIYNLMRIAYSTFGATTWGARAMICLFGSALVFLPLLFRRFLTPVVTIALTAAVALSPTLVYWSRFIREDTLILFWIALFLYAVTLAPAQWKGAISIIAITFFACLKENVFVMLAIAAGWLVYEAVILRLTRSQEVTLLERTGANLRRFPIYTLAGFLIAAFIYCYLYSEGFRYPAGITDFLSKSFSYWLDQHSMERIKGPFNFHLYVYAWYELPLTAYFLAALVGFYRSLSLTRLSIFGYITLAALVCSVYAVGKDVEQMFPWTLLKLKDPLDVFFAVWLLGHAVAVPTFHLLAKHRRLALWSYLFFANFFTYSYLGEKVPWLSVYGFTAGLGYGAVALTQYFEQHGSEELGNNYSVADLLRWLGLGIAVLAVLFAITEPTPDGHWSQESLQAIYFTFGIGSSLVIASYVDTILHAIGNKTTLLGRCHLGLVVGIVGALFTIRATILTNFVYAGQAREYLSQVHTTPDFHRMVKEIRSQIETPTNAVKPTVCASGEMTWPITWYFTDTPEYRFPTGDNNAQCDASDYRFIDFVADKPAPAGYRKYDITLRGWWVPDMSRMTVRNFLNYSLNHTPFSDTGFSWSTLLVKEKNH